MINGSEPIVGKQVYDMNLGYGKIISVEPDNAFVVDFGNSRRQRFSSGGFVGNIRRVYWENPIVVEPSREDKSWQTFIGIARSIYDLLQKVKGV